MAVGQIPAHQEGQGTSKDFDLQAGELPQCKEQTQAFLHSARLGTPPREGEERGKKAEFHTRDCARHRHSQPHVQLSTGSAGSRTTLHPAQ